MTLAQFSAMTEGTQEDWTIIATHALELLVDQLRHGGHSAVRRLTFVCPVRRGASVAPPRLRALNAG